MKRLSDKVLNALKERRNGVYEGIIFRYKICHVGQADVDFIERTGKYITSCRLYDINGKLVL